MKTGYRFKAVRGAGWWAGLRPPQKSAPQATISAIIVVHIRTGTYFERSSNTFRNSSNTFCFSSGVIFLSLSISSLRFWRSFRPFHQIKSEIAQPITTIRIISLFVIFRKPLHSHVWIMWVIRSNTHSQFISEVTGHLQPFVAFHMGCVVWSVQNQASTICASFSLSVPTPNPTSLPLPAFS